MITPRTRFLGLGMISGYMQVLASGLCTIHVQFLHARHAGWVARDGAWNGVCTVVCGMGFSGSLCFHGHQR